MGGLVLLYDRVMSEQDVDIAMAKYLKFWDFFLTICGFSCLEKVLIDGNDRYQVSRWKLLIPLIIVCGLCSLIYCLAREIPLEYTAVEETKISVYLNLTGNIVAAVSIICATLSSTEYANVKLRFLTFDHLITVDYKPLMKSILKYAAFFFTVYIFSFIIDFLAYQKDHSSGATFKIMAAYIFQFYNLLSILHFSVCLFWLRKAFALINTDLGRQTKLSNAWSKKTEAQTSLFYRNIAIPSFSFEDAQFRFKESKEIGGTAIQRLRFLRTLYHVAFELTRDVNTVFGTRNVVSVGYNFVVGTIFMYSGMSELVRRSNGNGDATPLELLFHFKWSFISFLSIYGLVWPCTATCNEAKRTIVIIQGLLIKGLDNELRAELQSTSFQFIHEQVSFAPHGFFSLNNNLLLSIMGAVVSYLVVLIQFRISMT